MKNWITTLLIILANYGLVKAQITFSPNHNIILCGPGTVHFVYNKIVEPDLVYWDFGDGHTSTQINPAHYYDSIGVFDVKLVVIKNNQRDSLVKTQMITINPVPLAGFSKTLLTQNPNPSGFEYEMVSLSVHNADSFNQQLWVIGTDSLYGYKINYTFLNSGKFLINLKVTNNKNCTANYSDTVYVGSSTIDTTTGVNLNQLDFKVAIYPNPASQNILITHQQQKQINVKMYNLLGEKQPLEPISTLNQTSIPIAHLPNGVYILTISNAGKQIAKRVTIVH